MGRDLRAINAARTYSDMRMSTLRDKVASALRTDAISICVVGSFGRREASDLSDLDFFVIKGDAKYDCDQDVETLRRLITEEGIKMPSKDGAFNSFVESAEEIDKNIGGFEDRTEKLTRRLLFLLEGDWLFNQDLFDDCRKKLVHHYVRDTITEHQLCRFLLNDLIRYYRTICVDFECKTHENGKSWGDRNIKLMFSRKLLYFSGILIVAQTWQRHWRTKREILAEYLRMTPIERVQAICGAQAASALAMYDGFLEKMSQPDIRRMLEMTPEDRDKHVPDFRKFKNEGHHFTLELSRLLAVTYDQAHPIHVALKF